MPLAKLRAAKKAGRAAVERQAPEPRNRILRREIVQDRHVSKQRFRELANGWSQVPEHVVD